MTPNERLREARAAAGFKNARQAAQAMGANYNTYAQHENGIREVSREAGKRYADFFRVSLDWLLRGKGAARPVRATQGDGHPIPVDGVVGAGAAILPFSDLDGAQDTIDLPTDGTLGALKVRGDSQYPRFMDGETVIYDRRPRPAADLLNRLAVVQVADGRRLLKTIRRGESNLWTLESHNAPPEHSVRVTAAWRVIGVLVY